MRILSLSPLLVLCTLLTSLAAPIDSGSHELSVSSRNLKAAKPPAAAKPAPAKAAAKPVPAKAAAKPVPAKVAPAKVAPAAKAATKATSKVPAPKTATKAKGKACKKGSKKTRNTDTEEEPECTPEELCAELTESGCNTCVGAGLGCAFDVKGDKCVTETTEGLTLATDKKSCTTLLAAEKAAAASKPTIDARVTAAAEKAFSKTVQDHIFVGSSSKKSSGRHILSAWTKANPAKSSPEQKRDKTTGVVEFKNGKDIKTVWNDVTGEGAAAGTFVYTEAQIKALCLRGYEQSILANTANAAILKAPATEAAGKKKLEITSGLKHGFVVHNAAINKNVCINVNEASCFPLGIGTASGAEGDACKGDSDVEE